MSEILGKFSDFRIFGDRILVSFFTEMFSLDGTLLEVTSNSFQIPRSQR